MRIFLDLDEVLTKLVDGVQKRLGVRVDEQEFERYEFWEFLGRTQKEVWDPLMDDYDFWRNLEKTEHADYLLNICREHTNDVYICTKPFLTAGCIRGKIDWLQYHFGINEEQVVFARDKSAIASPCSILIDDCDENIDKFRKRLGVGITFPRPWNEMKESSDTPIQHVEACLEDYLK